MCEDFRKLLKEKAGFPAVVYLTPEVKVKLDTLVLLPKGEISCLGMVKKLGKGELLVYEAILFKQTCNNADTTMDQGVISDHITDMIMDGEDPSTIRLWWHSHASMKPFWSPQDNETIAGFNNEWMVSIVTNFKGEYMCRLDVFQPIQATAFDIPVRVLLEPDEETFALLKAEVEEKVTFFVPKKTTFRRGQTNLLPPIVGTMEDDPFLGYPEVEDLNLPGPEGG